MADRGMEKLLRKAKEMQEQQNRRLGEATTEAAVAGGRITAKMNGHRALTSIHIDPDLVAVENGKMLEGQVVEVVNALVDQIDEILEKRFGIVDKMPSLSLENIFGRK